MQSVYNEEVKIRYRIGIDEVGRGPLAGPVAVGACMVEARAAKTFAKVFAAIRDSKQLSAEAREMWFSVIRREQKSGLLDYAVTFVSAAEIDRKGIAPAIRKALAASLRKLLREKNIQPEECRVFLDGSLYAPKEFLRQETIIKGDQKVKLISAAAVAAKVLRDRKMKMLAKKFPEYGFEIHKGYGTLAHRNAIKKHGPGAIHRMSFLTGILA